MTTIRGVETPSAGAGAGPTHLGWALTLISIAQLMVVLDATIANIAVPYISADLGFSDSTRTWVITGYALAFGGLLLVGGRLGDLYGRRRIFMLGLGVFAGASLLGGFASSSELLIAARALQGLGAALASPTALALISTTFPTGAERNRAFGVYAAMSGIGGAIGLILGGWLTGLNSFLGADISGWRLTFLINVPIGLAAVAFARKVLPESDSRAGRLDIPGALTGTLGLLALVYGLTRAGDPQHGWGDALTLSTLAAGVLLLVAFVVLERFVAHPLMPYHVIADRDRGASFLVMMLVPAAMFAMFFFLSLLVQNVMGYSPLKTGVAFLPFTVFIIISATIASKLMGRVDPRWLAGFGTVIAGLALYGLSRLPYDDTLGSLAVDASYATDMLPFISLMSFGMGFVFVPLTITAVHGVGDDDSGIGSGLLNTAQQVGGASGLAVLSTVAVRATNDKVSDLTQAAATSGPGDHAASFEVLAGQVAFTHGATQAFLVCAAMILAAALVAMVFLRVQHQELAADGNETVAAG